MAVPDGFETPHYWRKDNNSFFAYAPYPSETNGVTYSGTDASTGAPVIKYEMPELAADQPDILVATPILDQKTPAPGETKTVKLNFKHKLARMGFKFVNAYTMYIQDISISGIYTTGSTDINPTSEWSNLNGKENVIWSLFDRPTLPYDDNLFLHYDNQALMLIPQKLTSSAILKLTLGKDYFAHMGSTTLEIPLIDFLEEIKAGRNYTLIMDLGVKVLPIVESYNPANCFLVRPNSTVEFYTHQVGKSTNGDHFSPAPELFKTGIRNDLHGYSYFRILGGKSVKVNWQTAHGRAEIGDSPEMLIKPDGITYDSLTGKCTVKVTTPTTANIGGSAYISAYNGEDGTGNILWSWHIWVTEDEVTTFDTGITPEWVNGGGPVIQMQDRALGAISKNPEDKGGTFGMLYQHGRMDPFTPSIYSDNIEIQIYDKNGTPINKGTNSIGGKFTTESRQADHPLEFISNPTVLYLVGDHEELIKTRHITYYWSKYSIKTIYDPCPYGYVVPTEDFLDFSCGKYKYNSTKNGFEWHGSFFPLTGFRSIDDGTLNNVGTNKTCIWTSHFYTALDQNLNYGYVINFNHNHSNGNFQSSSPQSTGNTIRCIKEDPEDL